MLTDVHLELPDRVGDCFAELVKPITLGELIELNKS